MKKLFVLLLTMCVSTSCTVNKEMHATGGSKSDGYIELSYEIGEFETPVIDEEASLQTAIERCKAWNYRSAEKFGGSKSFCVQGGGFGCSLTRISYNYQCTN